MELSARQRRRREELAAESKLANMCLELELKVKQGEVECLKKDKALRDANDVIETFESELSSAKRSKEYQESCIQALTERSLLYELENRMNKGMFEDATMHLTLQLCKSDVEKVFAVDSGVETRCENRELELANIRLAFALNQTKKDLSVSEARREELELSFERVLEQRNAVATRAAQYVEEIDSYAKLLRATVEERDGGVREIHRRGKEMEQLRNQVENLTCAKVETERVLEEERRKVEDLTANVTDWQKKCEEREAEIGQCKAEIGDLKASAKETSDLVTKLQGQIVDLTLLLGKKDEMIETLHQQVRSATENSQASVMSKMESLFSKFASRFTEAELSQVDDATRTSSSPPSSVAAVRSHSSLPTRTVDSASQPQPPVQVGETQLEHEEVPEKSKAKRSVAVRKKGNQSKATMSKRGKEEQQACEEEDKHESESATDFPSGQPDSHQPSSSRKQVRKKGNQSNATVSKRGKEEQQACEEEDKNESESAIDFPSGQPDSHQPSRKQEAESIPEPPTQPSEDQQEVEEERPTTPPRRRTRRQATKQKEQEKEQGDEETPEKEKKRGQSRVDQLIAEESAPGLRRSPRGKKTREDEGNSEKDSPKRTRKADQGGADPKRQKRSLVRDTLRGAGTRRLGTTTLFSAMVDKFQPPALKKM